MIEPIPKSIAAKPVRDVAIPWATEDTNNIQKSPIGGRFELKQNMMQRLHVNGQFTMLPH